MESTHNKSTKMVTKSQLCHNWNRENGSLLFEKAYGSYRKKEMRNSTRP
jgi:hypothetical protein